LLPLFAGVRWAGKNNSYPLRISRCPRSNILIPISSPFGNFLICLFVALCWRPSLIASTFKQFHLHAATNFLFLLLSLSAFLRGRFLGHLMATSRSPASLGSQETPPNGWKSSRWAFDAPAAGQ